MKVSFGILFLVFVQALVANAQQPLPAGRTSVAHLEVGYSYANVSIPSLGWTNMNGVDLGATLDLSSRIGLDLTGTYVRGEHILVASQPSNLWTYAGGVVVYPLVMRHLSVRVRALFGGAKQEGANLGSHGKFLTGFVNQSAWIAGGAIDYKVDRSWSLRLSADYLRSSFFNPAGFLVPQNNFRAGVGVVYTFGVSHQRSRR
jgi:hypothetical protein